MFGLTPEQLTGPLAALFILLVMLLGFYSGRILPRSTVAREDYEELQAVNTSYATNFATLTQAVKDLATSVDRIRVNGNGKQP